MPLLYRVESVFKGFKFLKTPSIPKNFWTDRNLEDSKTARISVCESVDSCLSALSRPIEDSYLFVYSTDVEESKMVRVSCKEVPDAEITREIWLLEESNFTFEGKILVSNATEERKYLTEIGEFSLWKYLWRWI